MRLKETLWFDNNTEPPKNYWWVRDGKVYINNGKEWKFYVELPEEGGEPTPEPEPEPQPEPQPQPTIASWVNLCNEDAWNTEYANENSPLRKYYDYYDAMNFPYQEDLWNTVENRPANGLDMQTEDGRAPWDGGVPVTDENGKSIYTNCERCWKGAINAPDAVYPWASVEVPEGFVGTISFEYKGGDPVYPWGEEDREFTRGFAMASIPNELGMPELKVNEAGEAEVALEEGDLVITLIPKQESEEPQEETVA